MEIKTIKEIEIPEGYEVRIEDNKIIFELKESENEKIRKKILALVKEHAVNHERCQMEEYLEKQKSEELRDNRQITLMIESARMSGVIEGRKQVIDNPEEYINDKLSFKGARGINYLRKVNLKSYAYVAAAVRLLGDEVEEVVYSFEEYLKDI